MVERRRRGLSAPFGASGGIPVSEPELDMARVRPRQMGVCVIALLWAAWRWLAPGHAAVGPPMRSIDRELEESWPSWER